MSRADNKLEVAGCVWLALRYVGCSLLLYVLMFLAILGAGLFSKIFF